MELYEEFNGASSVWAKNVMSKKRRSRYFAQKQFFTECFKCWSTKTAIAAVNCAECFHET